MPKELSEAAKTEKDKPYNRPVELYQIFLETTTLYIAAGNFGDIEFFDEEGNSQTYENIGISRSDISKNEELKADTVNVSIDNVNREMSAYLQHDDFRGNKLKIMKVFLDADKEVESIAIFGRAGYQETVESYENYGLENAGNEIYMFEGVMDEPSVTEYQIDLSAVGPIDIADKEIPRRKYYLDCSWEFGDEETCGVEISEANNTQITGTVDSVEGDEQTQLYISEVDGDDEHYWAYGYIEINGHHRHIKDSGTDTSGGYIIIDMPFFEDVAGESCIITAGCDKTLDLEDEGVDYNHGCKFWNNEQFFGGFLSIPDARDVS